jgi:hypothetical protein
MISAWTKNLKTSEEVKKFEEAFKAATPVLERFQELLSEKEQEITNQELSSKIYDLPNWDYRQAHFNGFKSAIKLANQLINPRP